MHINASRCLKAPLSRRGYFVTLAFGYPRRTISADLTRPGWLLATVPGTSTPLLLEDAGSPSSSSITMQSGDPLRRDVEDNACKVRRNWIRLLGVALAEDLPAARPRTEP